MYHTVNIFILFIKEFSIKSGIYKHYKGQLYQVFVIARHSETQEEMVVYQALYGTYGLWVRPRAMFEEYVEHNGLRVERFTYLSASIQ